MDVKIQRINTYDDSRFSEKILKQHGAFVINDMILCEVEIVGESEAVIHGDVEEFYDMLIDEFRFYTEHICRFYNEKKEVIKEFQPKKLLAVALRDIQPSQFFVDEEKIEAVKSFIREPKEIIIPLIKDDGRYISLDGHTRLATAVEFGFEEVQGFCTEAGEYIFAFANEAKKRGICTPYDLKKVSHAEYDVLWNQFCDAFFEEEK